MIIFCSSSLDLSLLVRMLLEMTYQHTLRLLQVAMSILLSYLWRSCSESFRRLCFFITIWHGWLTISLWFTVCPDPSWRMFPINLLPYLVIISGYKVLYMLISNPIYFTSLSRSFWTINFSLTMLATLSRLVFPTSLISIILHVINEQTEDRCLRNLILICFYSLVVTSCSAYAMVT